MKNKKDPFKQWKVWSDEELRQSDLSSAKIELARRTGKQEDIELAINTLDNSTFNSIFILSLAKDSEQLKVLISNLETQLVPVLFNRRNMCVEGNEDVFEYFVTVTEGLLDGLLEEYRLALSTLSTKIIKSNSRLFTKLLSFGFKSYEIFYLNYSWLSGCISTRARAKIICDMMDSYALDADTLSVKQKLSIETLLQDNASFYTSEGYEELKDFVGHNCTVVPRSDEVWNYFKSLVDRDLLPVDTKLILAVPFLESDKKRFEQLSLMEKYYSIDNSLDGIKDKNGLQKVLDKYHLEDYPYYENRKLTNHTIDELVRLGAIALNKLDSDSAKDYVKSHNNKATLDYILNFVEKEDLFQLCGVHLNVYSCYFSNTVITSFENPEDSRRLISKLLNTVFEYYSHEVFITFVAKLLSVEGVFNLYDKEYMRELGKFICNNFGSVIGTYTCKQLYKLILSDEEYQEYEQRLEQERMKREQLRRQEILTEFDTIVTGEIDDISDFDSLLEVVEYFDSCDDEKNDILLRKAYSKSKELEPEQLTINSLEMFYRFLRENIIGITEFMAMVQYLKKSIEMEAK